MSALILSLLGVGSMIAATIYECRKLWRDHEKRMQQLEKEYKQAKEYYRKLGNG